MENRGWRERESERVSVRERDGELDEKEENYMLSSVSTVYVFQK